MIEDLIVQALMAAAGLWLGTQEWRIRNIDMRIRNAPSRDEMHKMIELKQESIKVMQDEIKEDIQSLNKKLDTLIKLELSRRP